MATVLFTPPNSPAASSGGARVLGGPNGPTATPQKAPAPTLSSIGGTLVNAAKSYAGNVATAAKQGVNQIESGFSQVQNGTTPLDPVEAGLKIGAGTVNTVLSPVAPVFAPVGKAVNAVADKVSNVPAVQKFAMSPAGAATQRVAGDVVNASTIMGALAGGEEAPSAPSDIAAGISKSSDVIGGSLNAAAGKVSDAASAAKAAVTPSLDSNVGKALGFTGKMTAGTALGKTAQATRALQAIVDNAPNIKVQDASGVEVPFNPAKATFAETLDAWTQTRNAIYKQYSDLATKAGGKGAVFSPDDFSSIENSLANAAKNTTSSFRSKVASLTDDLQKNFGTKDPETGEITYKNTPLSDVQSFLEKVNTDVNPLSDKAGAQVSQTLSQELRGKLDSKIQDSTGEGYQALRSKYADLKSVESDLVNQFKKAARGQTGTLSKLLEGYGSLDVIVSLMKGSPTEALFGAGSAGIGKFLDYIKNPQNALQRAFKQLQNTSTATKTSLSGSLAIPNKL